VAAAPFIAIAAVVAALVLVVEDLYAAFTGGESIIGGWVAAFAEAYPELAEFIKGIIDLAVSLAGIVTDVLGGAFGKLWDIIKTVFGGAFDFVKAIIGAIDTTIGAVKNLAGVEAAARNSAASSPVPASVQAAAGGVSTTQNTQIVINGAGDPAAVGQEVVKRGGLGASLQQSRPGATGPVTR
jgi:phage-related protein